MDDQIVHVEDVTVRHEGFVLLLPTTFDVPRGGCASVRGPNGSGKSTLLKVLAGRMSPSDGQATVHGAPADESSASFRRAVSALLGVPAYYDDLTLLDHLQLVARIWRGETQRSLLDELGMGSFAKRLPRELSSGQQQLFYLALALARPADVLILDEPEQRLDTEHRANLGAILRRRRDAGAAIIMATHDAGLASAVGTVELHLRASSEALP